MNILVLGASGLAGSAIARALRSNGHSVSGTCRTPFEHHDTPALLPFDLSEPQSIVPLLAQTHPDAVVSCLRGDFANQLETHRLTADFLCQHNGKLIYLSTANVFDGNLSQPHYEGDTLLSDSPYGQFKIACERLLRDHLNKNCVILRPPEIWGTSAPRLRTLVKNVSIGSPIQTYENLSVNYTTDDQIARWTVFILEHDLRGVFHVGTQDISDYTAFLDRLAERLGLPRPIYNVERNEAPSYQAVLPGRSEIPKELHLSVGALLNYLSKGVRLS